MEKKKKWNYLTIIAACFLAALIFLVLYIAKEYCDISSLQKKYENTLTETNYSAHCAFISGSGSERDSFRQSVYNAARAQGLEEGIYVEDFGKNLYVSYTTDELLQMAIAANVDAIILEATGDSSTTRLINEAVRQGIAVSTIYKDDMDSSRFSYTGVNNVSIGYDYGSLAILCSMPKATSVMVLLDSEEPPAEQRLLISGIGKALSEKRSKAHLDTMILDSSNAFEVDEQVREFLKEHHTSTDIIICTNLAQTQYVSQAAVDLNYVGEFTIIGSYQNYSVLELLKSGVISANIVIDAEQMGRQAVKNLAEYLSYGHSSDYSSVDFYTITGQDAARMLEELSTGEELESEEAGGQTDE